MNFQLSKARVSEILAHARQARILVVGDLMLDHFVWGKVERISPEAPVPVVVLERESFMPGGAGNVAHNLSVLGCKVELFGAVGSDVAAHQLGGLMRGYGVDCGGLIPCERMATTLKTRIVAHQQQVVRVDRETRNALNGDWSEHLIHKCRGAIDGAAAVIVADYGKGVVTQDLLSELRSLCRERAAWLSVDPKPIHKVDLSGVSLITPNRKEAFELAGISDGPRTANPLEDATLLRVAEKLLEDLRPAILLITLGEAGMLLCRRGERPLHIPTVAQEVFDVSGAGDTVIATFTLAIVSGASPVEAAVLSNHAAGLVVGKVGTATVTCAELIEPFE